MKHCNGCGRDDLPDSDFTGRDRRCRDCRCEREARRVTRYLTDPRLLAEFAEELARIPDPKVRDYVALPGIPRGPGVREARAALYKALHARGWSVDAIAAHARQSRVSVERGLNR